MRIQRFQHFLALAEQQPGAALSRLAAEAGYADQAHLTRECGRLSGLAPAALLAAGAAPAGEKSAPLTPRDGAVAALRGLKTVRSSRAAPAFATLAA